MFMRGSRRIVSVEPTAPSGFVWTFDCGHTESRPQRPTGQLRVVCKTCRTTTPSRPEDAKGSPGANRRLRDFRSAKGLCDRCPLPAESGRKRCRKHLDEMSAYRREWARKKRDSAQSESNDK